MVVVEIYDESCPRPVCYTGKIIYSDSHLICSYHKNGEYHRYYGPSTFSFRFSNKEWYINNCFYGDKINYNYSQKHFLKDIKNIWLL